MKPERNTSISHATLRRDDLLAAFMDYVPNNERFGHLHGEYMEIADPTVDSFVASENADYLLEAVFDALNDLAPDGCYFGAHPGDGSDFGFWEYEGE